MQKFTKKIKKGYTMYEMKIKNPAVFKSEGLMAVQM